ncbi:MAG: D-glycero-beta-D-manno-heptose-7-phosphate kinase [Angelakisella sp.]|nr:D-glycero-beta-D-manno-heptose-7-phosphate kinase [Angelakisella sp.]
MKTDMDVLDRLSGQKVIVFGDFMVDEYLQGSVSRVSPEAPVPVVLVQKQSRRLGGAGNVVLNLKALGAQATAVGLIGADTNGDWLIGQLKASGVDASGILRTRGIVTCTKTRITAQHQQLLRYDCEVVQDAGRDFLSFLSAEINRLTAEACAVIISDYGKGAVTDQTAKIVISAARERAIPVIVDPKGKHYCKYTGATACTPNLKELKTAVGRELHGEDDICQAGMELCQKCGIEYILVTRSEDGMSLIHGADGTKEDYPAIAKEVIDVTGAGDTVIAVFTLCFAAGAANSQCCTTANLAASIVVSKFGAATASVGEIRALLQTTTKQHSKIVSKEEAVRTAAALHRQGKRVVFTNGCFDIVHAGHISSFRKAREYGDVLFLALNSDASVRRIKGDKRPIVTQEHRLTLLESISEIDYLVLFDEDTPETLIREIRPDVLIKGKDWEGKAVAGGDFVQEYGGQVCFIDLEEGLSTTNIINKIRYIYGE